MSKLIRVYTTVLAATCLSLIACSDNKTATEDSTLTFAPCENNQTLECGEFEVPLIHGSTDNRRISIDVARLTGIGEGVREPLLLNFGGPGSGIEVLQEFAEMSILPDSVREHFDIIVFEQRGVANPLRVDCDQLGNVETSPYPRNRSDVQSLVDDTILLADACSAEYSDQLQWVGSNAVVQDMEIMRSMLNSPKLNIIGSSFGTRISALYLERYPNASGRIILDAPLRPNGKLESLLLDTTDAQQNSFEQLLNACGTTLTECDRSGVEAAFVARVNSLLDTGEEDIAGAFFNLLTIAIEESDNREFLAPLLINFALSGDPTDMFALIEEFGLDEDDEANEANEASEAGDYNNSITLERAVLCADDSLRPTTESLVTTLSQLNESSDFFAEAILPLASSCAGWPEALDPVADILTTDAPTSLVIGGNGDVTTPISWAIEMADALGGVFVSSNHLGHATVFTRKNNCVDSIVVDFLTDGTLPPAGTSCD